MNEIDEAHMNKIVNMAASNYFGPYYDDLVQVGRIAYWEFCEEQDSEALMVTKVRRRIIDAWRKTTHHRSKHPISFVELCEEYDKPVIDPDYFTPNCLGLPERHTYVISAIANGAMKSEVAKSLGVTPGAISHIIKASKTMCSL